MEQFYTHEANISCGEGFITFPFSFSFWGEGTVEDGIENLLKALFPMATEVVVRKMNQE